MASMSTIDASVSFWATAPYEQFTALCEQERRRMTLSPFSGQRLCLLEGADPTLKKKRKDSGRAYDEGEVAA